jgi:succinyl-CoA synthetase alpha subunit
MAILVDEATRVVVQGITGKVGAFQTGAMIASGTNVVAGVTPGKGGTMVEGVPVYDFVEDAMVHEPDVAISFVPARFAEDAAVEMIDSRVALLVITAAGIPDQSVLRVLHHARRNGTRILGPDTPGLVSPGRSKVGVHPDRVLAQGRIGIVSRSGALSYEVCKQIVEEGFGQSTVIGIGGGPLWDVTFVDVLEWFDRDTQTDAVVLLGEIGGGLEHEAGSYISTSMSKPVVALIVGGSAPRGAQLGHAGAIIEGDLETAEKKREALANAGVTVVMSAREIVQALQELGV